MALEVYAPQRKVRGFDLVGLRRRVRQLELVMDLVDKEACITLVSNQRIHELNRDYRAKDAPTDVLSFPQNEGEMAFINPSVLGDIVISVERAQEQYRGVPQAGRPTDTHSADWTLLDEVTHLLIHGLLHLLGYDHLVHSDAEAMEDEERRIWSKLRLLDR